MNRLLTVREASAYLTERLGTPISVDTLRNWRRTWPDGVRTGPVPLLLSPRKLRYAQADCDEYVTRTLREARSRWTEE